MGMVNYFVIHIDWLIRDQMLGVSVQKNDCVDAIFYSIRKNYRNSLKDFFSSQFFCVKTVHF